jgi:hypothetical protein
MLGGQGSLQNAHLFKPKKRRSSGNQAGREGGRAGGKTAHGIEKGAHADGRTSGGTLASGHATIGLAMGLKGAWKTSRHNARKPSSTNDHPL